MSAAPEINATFRSNGFTEELAPGPIGGPGAWRGPDIAKRADEWTYALSAAEIRELDDAMQRTRTSQILDIDKAAFNLSTLAATLAEIKHQLLEGQGFVLIRGVPVADYTLEDRHAFTGASACTLVRHDRKTPRGISSAMSATSATISIPSAIRPKRVFIRPATVNYSTRIPPTLSGSYVCKNRSQGR